MTARLAALAVLALLLAGGGALLLLHGVQLQVDAQNMYSGGTLTQSEQDRSNAIQVQANAFTAFVPGMFFAALVAALAIPAVLARRHQLTQRAQRPAR